MFCVPALALAPFSLLSDAFQRRNFESWLGGYGLVVGEWVVTTSPTNNISLVATALVVLSLFLCCSLSLRISVAVKRCVTQRVLSGACQRRNFASWLRGYGLVVGQWIVTTSPTNSISLLATALAVLSLFLCSSISPRIAVTV